MKNKVRSFIFFLIFWVLFCSIWKMPEKSLMTIHDWMLLIILEIPLQMSIKLAFDKEED